MKDGFITFGAPEINDDDIEAVVAVMRSGWLGTGPCVTQFERAAAAYKQVDASHAVALNSCTAALHLALLSAGVGPGDEVVTPAMTFCSVVNAILQTGATPVLADVDPVTMNMDAQALAGRLGPRTRAVVPVHFAGRPCEMDALLEVAKTANVAVIEDCAHAMEAAYRGSAVGTLGDFGCFSFYATKNLTTGEGGMVLARDVQQAARIRRMALQGLSDGAWRRYSGEGFRHYDVVDCGFKYNMPDLNAALGLQQLARLDKAWERRHAQWQRYQQAFADLPVTLPAPVPPHMRHAFHLYTLLIDEAACGMTRDAFAARMCDEGVGVGVHYRALPELAYYQDRLGWQPQDTPCATAIGRTTVSLPLGPRLTDSHIDQVIGTVRRLLA